MIDTVATIQAATDTVSALSALIDATISAVPKIISVATIIAAYMPPPGQVSFLWKLHKTINTMAFNFGYAKNAKAGSVGTITPDSIKK